MANTKKIVILTYSYTDNTNYAAQLLCNSLSSQDAIPTEDDLDCDQLAKKFPIIKDGNSPLKEIIIPESPYRFVLLDFVPFVRYVSFSKGQINTSNEEHDQAMVTRITNELESADIIGIGSMTFSWTTPPGFIDACRAIPALSVQMKPFFVFATAGQILGVVLSSLAFPFVEKGGLYIGRYGFPFAPDTYVIFNAPKDTPYHWGSDERKKIFVAGIDLRNKIEYAFEQLQKGQKVRTFLPRLPRAPLDQTYLKLAFKGIACDRERCSKCGLCISGCPFNAITRDVEDFPHFDASHCYGCTRCAARCPRHAVVVGGYSDTTFHKMNSTSLIAGPNDWKVLTLYKRALINACRVYPVIAGVVFVAVAVLIIYLLL